MNTKKSKTVAEKIWDQKFEISCSQRYHAYRMAWHQGMVLFLQFIELLMTFSVLLSFHGERWQRVVLWISFILGSMSLVQIANKHLEWHTAKKIAFGELMKTIPVNEESGTEKDLQAIVARREEIEKDDTVGFRCLDVLCYNEECLARGLNNKIIHLPWWRRYIGLILPLNCFPCTPTQTGTDKPSPSQNS